MRVHILKSFMILSMFILTIGNLHASETVCSQDEAIAAETESGALKSWQDVYHSYKKYHQCDDGAIAEGYSDSITLLLANNWSSLNNLKSLVDKDKDFLKFILKHIDATTNSDDVQKVYENASQQCPKDSKKLCSLIKKEAEDTLREFKKIGFPSTAQLANPADPAQAPGS